MSTDDENCQWCAEHHAVVVTTDRGRKDRAILDALAREHVHAIFLYKELRTAPPHHVVRALLSAEAAIDDQVSRPRGLLRHRLSVRGHLEKR
jgi:hypothetical protein